jgi:hypothetical protein
MILSTIPDVLAIVLALVMSTISIRAFVFYARIRVPLFCILGLAMGLLALTALADFASSHITTVRLNTDWFLYTGQAVSFLFIFLSLLTSAEGYQRLLMRWHVFLSLAALFLLFLAPVLPAFPNVMVRSILSSLRGVFCFLIFLRYTALFMTKESRFGLFMATSFFLLSLGYLIILLQYAAPMPGLFDNLGDLIRIGGLLLLLVAFRQ